MTKVLIDVALVAIACLAGGSLLSSGRQFLVLFAQLRAEMAAGLPTQTMRVTTCSTGVDTTLGAITTCHADAITGSLALKSRMRPRPAAMRAAA